MADRSELGARGLIWLIRRNALLIALGTLIGALAGLALTTLNPAYGATVVVEVSTGADAGQTATLVESAASTIESPAIIEQAATTLGVPQAVLAPSVSADVQAGTNLINLTTVAANPDEAVKAATEVVDVAISDYRTRSDQRAKQVRDAGAKMLADGTLDSPRAESAREASIGSVVGTAQGDAIQDTVTLSVASPALGAYRTGVSRPVGIILGAAAGALLTSLLALSRVWNRRRPIHNLADLEQAASGLTSAVEPAEHAAGLAMTAGREVILVLGDDEAGREALARNTVDGMTRNGVRAALVTLVSGDQAMQQVDQDRWEVGVDRGSEALSRANRRELPTRLGVDAVVIAAPLSEDTRGYLAGQDDYLAFVAIVRGTRIWQATEQFEQVAAAHPVGVLQV